MVVTTGYEEVGVGGRPMRAFVAAPRERGDYPGVLFYSDIFQLSGPMLRACTRLAGYGFVVAAPEIYHRLEPPGTVLPFDDPGRTRGLDDARRTSVADFDADCRAALDHLKEHPLVASGRLLAAGFCLGGHLAFRAALQPDVLATACFYPTGLHDGALGHEPDAGSLARAGEIRGELLLVFGADDPHVPVDARHAIPDVLARARTRHTVRLYSAEHAFMRDEGPRYDPEATDLAWGDMVELFRRALRPAGSLR